LIDVNKIKRLRRELRNMGSIRACNAVARITSFVCYCFLQDFATVPRAAFVSPLNAGMRGTSQKVHPPTRQQDAASIQIDLNRLTHRELLAMLLDDGNTIRVSHGRPRGMDGQRGLGTANG
jgi:hypothetical protein